jgi:hypothetical protein
MARDVLQRLGEIGWPSFYETSPAVVTVNLENTIEAQSAAVVDDSMFIHATQINIHCTPDQFRPVIAIVLRALEVWCEVEKRDLFKCFIMKSYHQGLRKHEIFDQVVDIEGVPDGSIAWASAGPFVSGIVTAFRADRRVTPESDELSKLLLDRRLIRTKGALMSSFMAGAVVPFLPSFPPE